MVGRHPFRSQTPSVNSPRLSTVIAKIEPAPSAGPFPDRPQAIRTGCANLHGEAKRKEFAMIFRGLEGVGGPRALPTQPLAPYQIWG